MGSFDVKITDNTPKFLARLRSASQIVRKAAFDAEGGAKVRIKNGRKTGRRYGRHTASAPGESPASDTGKLANSVMAQKEDDYSWIVTVSSLYAVMLEMGTRRMGARPFLFPAVMAVSKAFQQAIEGIFRD